MLHRHAMIKTLHMLPQVGKPACHEAPPEHVKVSTVTCHEGSHITIKGFSYAPRVTRLCHEPPGEQDLSHCTVGTVNITTGGIPYVVTNVPWVDMLSIGRCLPQGFTPTYISNSLAMEMPSNRQEKVVNITIGSRFGHMQ